MIGYPSARRHPRSTMEAFPADGACAIEIYPESWLRRFARAAVCIACAVAIGALAAQAF